MPVIRLILLLLVLGGLTLLLVQNWSPVIPLVFLGMKTQPIPLAIWILFSLVAGGLTALLITGLFNLSSYFARSGRTQRRPQGVESERTKQRTETRSPAAERSPKVETTSTSANDDQEEFDDWEDNDSNQDWDVQTDTEQPPNTNVRDSTTYEVNSEPKSGYRSGSVYSYNYREPRNSGVGKTESVYDADYRVLTPPYRQPNTTQQDEEDWGFEDDEET